MPRPLSQFLRSNIQETHLILLFDVVSHSFLCGASRKCILTDATQGKIQTIKRKVLDINDRITWGMVVLPLVTVAAVYPLILIIIGLIILINDFKVRD